jgi:quercetin dioxygenase-like cupin family protein
VTSARFGRHARLAGIALVVVICGRLLAGSVAAHAAAAPRESGHVALETALPAMHGERLHATLVEVTYPPGGSSPPHAHRCPVVGRVIDGALHTRVAGGADTVYHAGESFREDANRAHVISSNASDLAPVTFLVWFVCDDDGPRTVALAGSAAR